MTSSKRLLAVFAHPDDETFGSGSTLAHYASQGVDISLVCATRGEVGEIAPGVDATRETLGAVREGELRAALNVLGVQSLAILGYRDSGMARTDDNKNPAAFINAPEPEVLQRLVDIMRTFRPHVVITMDLNGGYGHPDHIRASELTTQAFHSAGDPSFSSPNSVPPWTSSRLYYHTFPRSMLMQWMEYMKEINPDSDMVDIDPNTMGLPDEEITTIVDVSAHIETRMRAIEQHRSQASPFTAFPQELTEQVLRKDHFQRAGPGRGGGPTETDLF